MVELDSGDKEVPDDVPMDPEPSPQTGPHSLPLPPEPMSVAQEEHERGAGSIFLVVLQSRIEGPF